MSLARQQIGLKEIPGPRHNATIIRWLERLGSWVRDDETPWCSSYVNWVFLMAGMQRTKSAAAISWLSWGMPMKKPKVHSRT
jgi:uncharacterized protein (TIGR02594 family)